MEPARNRPRQRRLGRWPRSHEDTQFEPGSRSIPPIASGLTHSKTATHATVLVRVRLMKRINCAVLQPLFPSSHLVEEAGSSSDGIDATVCCPRDRMSDSAYCRKVTL